MKVLLKRMDCEAELVEVAQGEFKQFCRQQFLKIHLPMAACGFISEMCSIDNNM
jgi:hypothetical protein